MRRLFEQRQKSTSEPTSTLTSALIEQDPPQSAVAPHPMKKSFPSGIKELHGPADAIIEYEHLFPRLAQVTEPPSIVFIHGLTGDREKTWTATHASEPWPKTLLPSKLPTARILTYGYDAFVADWKGVVSHSRIANHAYNLLTYLASYREEDDTVGSSSHAN